jgi:ABC-type transporter Mla MlaB component
MTLRIIRVEPGPPATIKLDGRLTVAEVVELRHACEEVKGQLRLDLTDLRSVDRQGVSVLRELQARGAELMGLSPYMRLLLEPRGA